MRLEEADIAEKRVFIRADLNVPMQDGQIANDARIRASLPTISKVLEKNCAVTVLSHLGRPEEGKFDEAFSLAPIAQRLSELLSVPVILLKDIEQSKTLSKGQIGLMENVRFFAGEKGNSDELGRRMAACCDVFIMDAFGSAHRAHASTNSIAKHVEVVVPGFLMESELKALNGVVQNAKTPVVAVLGGAKVSSKLTLLERFSEISDKIFVGGGIANTFIAASGHGIGKSLHEETMLDAARKLLSKTDIPIPKDVMVAKSFDSSATAILRLIDEVHEDEMILDIGPVTAREWSSTIEEAGTIIWNGPMGVFEFDQFGEGTREIAEAIARSSAYSLAGGGDTIAAIDKYEVSDNVSYISTGGGAFMEYLEGKKLPGVDIL